MTDQAPKPPRYAALIGAATAFVACIALVLVLAALDVLNFSRGLYFWPVVWAALAGTVSLLRIRSFTAGVWSVTLGAVTLSIFIGMNFKAVRVEGESMSPTLRPGDVLLVDKTEPPDTRFGVYVIEVQTEKQNPLVKRLVGVPGDVMQARFGRVFAGELEVYPRNGETPDTWYRERPAYASLHRDGLELPEGRFYFMGDNPPESRDSRHFGAVDSGSVQGRVVWSLRGSLGFGPFKHQGD